MTTVDPRKYFKVKDCDASNKSQAIEQSNRRDTLNAITKLGNLEVLNSVGFGKVGSGLRTLSSVSNTIRVGKSVVPGLENTDTHRSVLGKFANTALDSVDAGANVVLDTVGLSGAIDIVKNIDPNTANIAYGEAKKVFSDVKQGRFSLSNIPESFANLQNLETLARGIFSSAKAPSKREYSLCSASPYAMDLIAYAPKFNFLFVIDVEFSKEYQAWNNIASNMAFVVKKSSRPGIEFEYDDVNMYNFRTKVARKAIYSPMSMSFYDDNKNAGNLFYIAYMRAMSPIANMYQPHMNPDFYELNGMNFNRKSDTTTFYKSEPVSKGYAATLGPMAGSSKSILTRIRLFHIFDYGRLMNIYNFYNPKITSFSLSELTMDSRDGTEFEFAFNYDGMFIEPGFSVQAGGDNKNLEDITSNGGSAKYPIKPIFDDDAKPSENSQQGLAPISQDQLNEKSSHTAHKLGEFVVDNSNTGATGSIGDMFNSGKKVVSDAFSKATNFVGSVFK